MKNHFLIFVAALSLSCTSLSNDKKGNAKLASSNTWITFKSNRGFEIQYPSSCMEVVISDAYDMEKKVEDVDSIGIIEKDSKCSFGRKAPEIGISEYIRNDQKDTPQVRLKKMHEGIDATKNINSGENFMNKLTENSLLSIYTTSSVVNDTIYWEMYKPCNGGLFLFRIATHTTDVTSALITAIKKGDPSIPEIEKKIIDSFKCLRKEAK